VQNEKRKDAQINLVSAKVKNCRNNALLAFPWPMEGSAE
jgi:hypothetical protein